MREMRRIEDITSHYYSECPDTAHDFEQWAFELKGRTFQFVTDSGIFSCGTADYGSRVLVDAFDWKELPDEGKVPDVGCGYGPIGLALASITQRPVEMIDTNERVTSLARGNAKRNRTEYIDTHQSNAYEAVHEEIYAAIVSNPLIRAGKKVIYEILMGAYPRLKKGGTLTVMIQKKQGAPSAQRKTEETFGNAEIVTKDKGYYTTKNVKE